MSTPSTIKTDILIAGSGFAGSLSALGLHRLGFDVCLVEKSKHPRFAVGESSTPIADMILRDLSDRYDLPWLHDLSRYGSWQDSHPGIVCGLKRGFSYYYHRPGRGFHTDSDHRYELLVAASSSDEHSDTHWMRSDVDAFLVDKVKENGISYFDETEITEGDRQPGKWTFRAHRNGRPLTFQSSFYLDATGGPELLNRMLGIDSSQDDFLTDSRALYSHFDGVGRWSELLKQSGFSTTDYPYDPDHSALHHLSDRGWVWMLRFNDGRTSVGILLDRKKTEPGDDLAPQQEWKQRIAEFPSVKKLMSDASLNPVPGKIIRTGRLQRKLSCAYGPGWAALPHSIGFVDPLHSTGIALTLTGVEKLLELFSNYRDDREKFKKGLQRYKRSVFTELKLVDRLIAGGYRTLHHFELFNIWSMLYFTAAVHYEQRRFKGDRPSHFLCAGDRRMVEMVGSTWTELNELLGRDTLGEEEIGRFRQQVRSRIEPYNVAGLLDPSARNMYRHTAVEL